MLMISLLGSLTPQVYRVLRNHNGILFGIFSLSVGILDSNIAELRAIVKAIELSVFNCCLHHIHIIIESDSANVISWMNKPHNRPWLHHNLFSSVQRLASCFGSLTFTHSVSESNHMADHLAKKGVLRNTEFFAWLWIFQLNCGFSFSFISSCDFWRI